MSQAPTPHDHAARSTEDHDHDHGRGRGHSHAHEHGHAHAHVAPQDFTRALGIGIALNLAFVCVEAYFGWRSNALSLLADAAHNLSDVAGLVLAWGGAAAARLKPDARHTYGWKRASILAATANAVLLLVAMGSLGWEALQRLQAPEPTQGWTVVAVAALGIVVNTATALLFLRGREHDLNVRGAFVHMAADALVSLGVVVAGALYLWRGWAWLDPLMSLVIAVVIIAGTWGLLRQSVHLLFDGVPDHVDLRAVRDYLGSRPGITGVHDLHVWAMSTTQVALTAHLIAPAGAPGDDFLRQTTEELHARFDIDHVTLQFVAVPFMTLCEHGG